MQFHPNYPTDNNKGQRELWRQIKGALSQDEGVVYYRYPIFATTGRGRKEPDFLIVHRRYGIWVLESKGCLIGNIGAIEGHDWIMRDWYSESMSPVSQVEAQFYEVKTLVERDPVLRKLRICFEYRVVLPFVTKAEWTGSGFAHHPSTEEVVWLQEDIDRANLRKHLKEVTERYMPGLSDAEWERLLGVFRGVITDEEPREPVPHSPPASPSRIIHAVESRLRVLDEKQDRIAQEVPEGPQRIRGLAGTGKTILFARRVAQMHASNPDWNIAFVYWSRSLNQMMKELVENTYRRMTGDAPDWGRLRVWHVWGSRDQTGFYREVAHHWNCRFLPLNQAKDTTEGNESPFEAAMRLLEKECHDSPPFLDAILVDEGQDLPAPFYQVAYQTLRNPKRLYWAYDEAQGIDSLIVPHAAEIFGRDNQGNPKVDLAGFYPSGMQKAHNMNRCYRTPRLILTAAHAINMGLLREGGPLQGVTRKSDWADLGYEVVEGDFSSASVKAGRPVVIERKADTSGHPVDSHNFDIPFDSGQVLRIHISPTKDEEIEYVVNNIQHDLESGLHPEDVAVICLDPWFSLISEISDRLLQLGIQTLVLDNQNKDKFHEKGRVTLSGVRRAKGNETYKVYALNLHRAGASIVDSVEKEMVARNQVFVALTRSKLWCIAVGQDGEIMRELVQAKEQLGRLKFPAFNQASLKRSMEDQDIQVQIEL